MKIKKINLDTSKRWIIISDIHGNYDWFTRLLNQVKYNENDILILVGDITSKGKESLKTLRYIYELAQRNEVYCLMGNCDEVALMVNQAEDLEAFRQYLMRVPNVVTEMCQSANIELNEHVDMLELNHKVKQSFPELFDFMDSFLDILDTPTHIFTHAGYDPALPFIEDRSLFLCSNRAFFMEEDIFCEKWMVVGHMPSLGYGGEVYTANPIFDEKNHRISVDGGNVIKQHGQLNALIYENNQYQSTYVDDFTQSTRVIHNQASDYDFALPYSLRNLAWIDADKQKVRVLANQKIGYAAETWDENDQLVGGATNSYLELVEGEMVSLLEEYNDAYLIKKEGMIGLAHKQNLQVK